MTKLIIPGKDDTDKYGAHADNPSTTNDKFRTDYMQAPKPEDGRNLSELSREERLKLMLGEFNPDYIPIMIGWRIAVLPPLIDDQFKGGIWKPEVTKKGERYNGAYGYLAAVGEGFNRHKQTGKEWCFANASPGDLVVYGKWSGTTVWVDDDAGKRQFFLILNDDEILGIVHPDAKCGTATPEMLNNLL